MRTLHLLLRPYFSVHGKAVEACMQPTQSAAETSYPATHLPASILGEAHSKVVDAHP